MTACGDILETLARSLCKEAENSTLLEEKGRGKSFFRLVCRQILIFDKE